MRFQPGPRHLLPLLALIAACGGKSCSCLGAIPGGFPIDSRRHEDALQVRITQSAVESFASHAVFAGALLPPSFDITPSCGASNKLCCGSPQPTCTVDIDVMDVGLTPSAPDFMGVDVQTALVSATPIPVEYEVSPGGPIAYCQVSIDTTKSTTQYKAIDVVFDLYLAVDSTTKLTKVGLWNLDVKNLDASMLSVTGDATCETYSSSVKSFVLSMLPMELGKRINAGADDTFCASCMSKSDCDGWADDCVGGKCMRQGKCLQEIGAQGRLDLSYIWSAFAPTHAQLDLLAVLGGYAKVHAIPGAGGISLGLLGGAQASSHDPCVPIRPAPDVPTIPVWTQESSNTEPVGGKTYHVGIGLHEAHLNTLAWSAFDSGAFCLNVGTSSVPQLDSRALSLLFPSLADLTHGANVPIRLAMRPSQEPHLTLGAGTFGTDTSGNRTIKDPILHVQMPQLSVDFYVLIEERYVRVATVTTDATLGVALDFDAQGHIVPMLGDVSGAFGNVTVSNTKLLSELPTAFANAAPALLAIAVGEFGRLEPLSLPRIGGLALKPMAIEPIDQSFLGIFTNIGLTMDPFHAETEARVLSVVVPPTDAFRADSGLDPANTPRVRLALDGTGRAGDASDLEWSFRLDDGFWTPFQRNPGFELSDPRLWLQGRHHLDVRARIEGEPETTDPTPVRLEVIVDTVAPVGTFDLEGNQLVFAATDAVSPPEALEYSYRLPGGDWSPWSRTSCATIATVDGSGGDPPAADLEVRVRDEAGNVGSLHPVEGGAPMSGGSGCGCRVGSRDHSSGGQNMGLLASLSVAALMVLGRRSKRWKRGGRALPFAIVAVATTSLGAAGCDDTSVLLGKDQLLDPQDQIGRYSDAVAASGVIHITAYDDTYGDLAYAELEEQDVSKPIEWQWVDGVPTGGLPNVDAYRRGSSDPGDDVGLYTSLALTHDGQPRIAYYDATHEGLRYAAGDRRTFSSIAVDTPTTGRAGLYASLSLGPDDVPSIAYMVTGIPDGKGGFVSTLRVAAAKVSAPRDASDFIFLDVETTPMSCAGLCAADQACVPTDPNDETKSLCHAVDTAPCPSPCSATEACIGGACAAILVPPGITDLPEGTGLFASLERLPSGLHAVVYHNRDQGNLKLVMETAPGVWNAAFTVDGDSTAGDVGQFATAALAPDGTLHVAYKDALLDRLLYKTVKDNVAMPQPEIVDDGARTDGQHPVGGGAALWTDGSKVRIAYQDQRTAELWMARRENGIWSKAPARIGDAGYGFYPHIVSDGESVFLTQFVYDRTAAAMGRPLGSLQVSVLP